MTNKLVEIEKEYAYIKGQSDLTKEESKKVRKELKELFNL